MSREPDLSPEAPHVQNVGFWNERHGGDQPSGRRQELVLCPRGHQGILAGEQGPGSLAPDVPLAQPSGEADSRGPVAVHALGEARASAWPARRAGRRTSRVASSTPVTPPSSLSTPSVTCQATRERATGNRGPLSSPGGSCDDTVVQNRPQNSCPGNGRPSRAATGWPTLTGDSGCSWSRQVCRGR